MFNLIVFELHLKKLHAINYFIIILIFISVLLLGRGIISAFFSKKEARIFRTEDKTIAAPELKNIMSYAPILEKNPFGSPMQLTPLGADSRTEKKSLKDLILLGTAVGTEGFGYAVFEDKGNPESPGEEIFRYGEEVRNYGKLTKIEKTKVELTQDGTALTLLMIDQQAGDTGSDAKAASSDASFVKKVGKSSYLLDQKKVLQSLENPDKILTDARLLPNMEKGRQKGFIVSEVRSGGLYDRLGIQNNDVLLKVNDLEVSNPEAAMQAMMSLKGMNWVNLDIIRNGSKMTLKYQMQ